MKNHEKKKPRERTGYSPVIIAFRKNIIENKYLQTSFNSEVLEIEMGEKLVFQAKILRKR